MTYNTLDFIGKLRLPPCTCFRGNLNNLAWSVSTFLDKFAKQFKIDSYFSRVSTPVIPHWTTRLQLVRFSWNFVWSRCNFAWSQTKIRDILHRDLRVFMIKLARSWGNGRKNGIPAFTRLCLESSDFNEVVYYDTTLQLLSLAYRPTKLICVFWRRNYNWVRLGLNL